MLCVFAVFYVAISISEYLKVIDSIPSFRYRSIEQEIARIFAEHARAEFGGNTYSLKQKINAKFLKLCVCVSDMYHTNKSIFFLKTLFVQIWSYDLFVITLDYKMEGLIIKQFSQIFFLKRNVSIRKNIMR